MRNLLFALALVFLAAFLASCSSPTATAVEPRQCAVSITLTLGQPSPDTLVVTCPRSSFDSLKVTP